MSFGNFDGHIPVPRVEAGVPEAGAPKEAEPQFQPYDLIRPIEEELEELGGMYRFDPGEDEIFKSRMMFTRIQKEITDLLARFEGENKDGSCSHWSEYNDAKSYLEQRLRAVEYVLEEIKKASAIAQQ